jgi:phosphatidylserine/phosphatidylglycerophosphate/cardiolipin synthase-like enzyme
MNSAAPLRDALRALLRAEAEDAGVERLAAAVAMEMATHGARKLPDHVASEISEAMRDANRVSLIVTGLGWLGGGIRAIENALLALIAAAERELAIAAYALTPGPERLWTAVERALDGGIRCTLVINRLDDQNPEMRGWLGRLSERHPDTLRVADFRGEDNNDHLHAKVIVADRRRAIVGSANLTAHGLLLAHELALLVEGPAADAIAERIDLLARSHLVRNPS